MISARSNRTFGVVYDEPGSPKEDRIAESRLRCGGGRPAGNRGGGGFSSSRGRSDAEQGTFEEGDTVLATVGEGRGGQERAEEARVEAYLGDGVYRVRFTDGSGTRELESDKLR